VNEALEEPPPGSWPIAEVLVIDNDPNGSAGPVIRRFVDAADPTVPVRYIHEPRPGVANARNRALADASGEVLVFIDDDEVPGHGWPHGLLTVLDQTGAAMVGGPVLTRFTVDPPRWVIDGRFFERDDPDHQSSQMWLRSGNLAVDRGQVQAADLRFDPRFRQGEDSAFTRSARAVGLDLRWSEVGAITEFVDADRFSPEWHIRREYASNRSWTRSSLDLAGGVVGRARVRGRALAVAVVRAIQSVVQLFRGVVTGRRSHRVHGLAGVAGAVGRLVELVTYRRP